MRLKPRRRRRPDPLKALLRRSAATLRAIARHPTTPRDQAERLLRLAEAVGRLVPS